MSSSLRAAALHAPAATALAVGLLAAALPATAVADATQIGIFLGPRVYAGDSRLGYLSEPLFHPDLNGAVAFGARVARPFFPWLIPELELAIAPTDTSARAARTGPMSCGSSRAFTSGSTSCPGDASCRSSSWAGARPSQRRRRA